MFESYYRALGPSSLRLGVVGSSLNGWMAVAQGVQLGHEVVMWDDEHGQIEAKMTGESDLDAMLRANQRTRRLRFARDLASTITECMVVVIAPPPSWLEDGTFDPAPLERLAKELAPCLSGYTLLVFRSGSPAGMATRFANWIEAQLVPGASIGIATCYEPIVPGRVFEQALYGDRLLIGVDHPWDANLLETILAPLERFVVVTSLANAESLAAAPALETVEHAYFEAISDMCQHVSTELRHLWDGGIFAPQASLELAL